MKLLSWNCRGLGNPHTVQSLGLLIKEKDPDMVFLMETRLYGDRARNIARRFKFEGCIVVDAVGRSGGFLLFWKQDIHYELFNYSKRHINGFVYNKKAGPKWMLSCFYGDPIVSQRSESWRLLKSFKPDNMGWCIIGDFNEILSNDEKKGGRIRGEHQMNLFRHVVEDGQLFDLGWRGAKFTWSNRHEDSSFTKERLDRALANKEWKKIFTVSSVETMTALCSDHSPIFLDCKSGYGSGYRRSYNQFKYDASWSKEEVCTDLISNEWLKRADCGS
ncbi:hypothetical protein F2P56_004054 [Juglans regia]|uniref:Endonuclease/exonuclease/phosphatase domain-containing protein n=2 Tax=Juglans regia TaxID=51240 RepID=A0A834D164_JUGRE|nr:uncharacterized protein LOC108995794 [Juglans regia]KAF5477414.1 hypothetical protein F2P56_004054 [Juglans regia]